MRDIKTVAQKMLKLTDDPVEYSTEGFSLGHANWMLVGIVAHYIRGDKAQRWLGYVQGIFISQGVTTLEELKKLNKEN